MIYDIFFVGLLAISLYLSWRISVIDFKRRIIPDVYLLPLALFGLVFVAFFPWICTVQDAVLGATFGYLLSSLTKFVFNKIKPQQTISPIGMGDIKLLSTGGIWLGTVGLSIALVFSCIFGIAWGLIKKEKYIPFAPFFMAGSFLSFLILWFLI